MCAACGTRNASDSSFCEQCGAALSSEASASDSASRTETVAIDTRDLQFLWNSEDGNGPTAHTVQIQTDIGKRHHVNQDAGGAWSWVRSDGTPASLLLVADGVSAGVHSEEASRQTVATVFDRVSPLVQDSGTDIDDVLRALAEAVKEANHQVAQRPYQSVASADATTVVCAVAVGSRAGGAWVGDSRAYLVSDGKITRLTRDHSWAEGVIGQGLMTEEQASRDPRAHMIMRWLGPPDREDPGVDLFRVQLQPGDVLFCCTDGLYGYYSPPRSRPEEMASVIDSFGERLQEALEVLIAVALDRGGHDNITIAAMRTADASSSHLDPANAPDTGDPADDLDLDDLDRKG